MSHILFSPKMKLADVLLTNYKLLLVLNRFDIHLGFGEKSVDEVCMKQNIPTSLFLLVCNVYTFADYLPQEKDLQSFDTESLMRYLLNSHLYYKQKCLPGINSKLNDVAKKLDEKTARVLQRFYNDYQTEVLNHFEYEENVAFPYINYVAKGDHTAAYNIGQYEENHSNIDEKLNDLKNIIIKYLPYVDAQEELNALLFDLFELEDDFQKHTLMEDKVLVPLVSQLEQK